MGPLLPLLMAAAPLLSKVFGGAAQGSAAQRTDENQQRLQEAHLRNQLNLARAQAMNSDAMNRAQLALSDRNSAAQTDLARRQFQQNEPNAQARQALTGSLLQRIQPVSLSGLSDRVPVPALNNSIISAIGPEAREAGGLLASRGLSGLQRGGTTFDPLASIAMAPSVSIPEMSSVPLAQRSSLLEKILGGLAAGTSVIGALGNLKSVDPGPTFQNATPAPYTGLDQYGNPNDFTLPRGTFGGG